MLLCSKSREREEERDREAKRVNSINKGRRSEELATHQEACDQPVGQGVGVEGLLDGECKLEL